MSGDALLTYADAAAIIGCKREQIYHYVASGDLVDDFTITPKKRAPKNLQRITRASAEALADELRDRGRRTRQSRPKSRAPSDVLEDINDRLASLEARVEREQSARDAAFELKALADDQAQRLEDQIAENERLRADNAALLKRIVDLGGDMESSSLRAKADTEKLRRYGGALTQLLAPESPGESRSTKKDSR